MQVNQSTTERRRELERATRHRNAGQLSRLGSAAPRTLQVKIITPWLSTPLLLSRGLGERGGGGGGGGGSLYYNKITAIKQATRLNGND